MILLSTLKLFLTVSNVFSLCLFSRQIHSRKWALKGRGLLSCRCWT